MPASIKIGTNDFTYQRLPADQGLRALLRLLKIAGPARGVLEAFMSEDRERHAAMILDGVSSWLTLFDPDDVFEFLIDLVSNARMNGEPLSRQLIPMLDTVEVLQLAQFCITTEFGGFFEEGSEKSFIRPRQAKA